LDVCIVEGPCFLIVEAEIPNSSVQPGFVYTAKIDLVPNDIMAGRPVILRGYLIRFPVWIHEICLSFEADVIELPK
jgi:hypothetical protein